MSDFGYSYSDINQYQSRFMPSTVHVSNTQLSRFFQRQLLERAFAVYRWELPERWNRDYFLYTLYCLGTVAVVNTDKYGVIPQQCGLSGRGIFYQPTHAVIANPLLSGVTMPQIGTQCTLFKLRPDYSGYLDLVSYYGDQLALCAQTAGVNLLNSKISYVLAAGNQQGANSLKKMVDDILSGNPAVAIDKALLKSDGSPSWSMFEQNVGQNYIVDKVLADMRKIEMAYDTAIGIPNANTDKKERLISNEVEANNTEVSSAAGLRLEALQEVAEQTNQMFGTSIRVDWRVDPNHIRTLEVETSES